MEGKLLLSNNNSVTSICATIEAPDNVIAVSVWAEK
jgi:hypothetical protein